MTEYDDIIVQRPIPMTPEDTLIWLGLDCAAAAQFWEVDPDRMTFQDSAAYTAELGDMERNARISRDAAKLGESHRSMVRGLVTAIEAVPDLAYDPYMAY